MPKISFTTALRRFFPTLKSVQVSGETLYDVLNEVERLHPGIKDYILEQDGSLRKHVNIFIAGTLIADRRELSDPFNSDDEIYIFQALSGG